MDTEGSLRLPSRIRGLLRCPACGGTLTPHAGPGSAVEDGSLDCADCRRRWPIRGGVPELVFPEQLQSQDARARDLWNRLAGVYGAIHRVTSLIRGIDSRAERQALIAGLGLRPGDVVLELGAGTGRNLAVIAEALRNDGTIVGLDLSPGMLRRARQWLGGHPCPPTLVQGNAMALPFADGVFDAVLDGFGSKYYSDKRRAIREMLRVVKPGGKVVLAELGLPPDKPRTIRQRLLRLWIPGFDAGPPLDAVPRGVADLAVAWDRHETAYTLQFRR